MGSGDDKPSGVPDYWERARRELARRDAILGAIIRQHPGAMLRSRGTPFATLARAIVGQQISVKASEAVWARLAGAAGTVTPRAVLALDEASLRGCGLSVRKVEYVRDLARHFAEGRIVPANWARMDDEAVIRELVRIRGIGRWTAEMFLIFNLLRADVLPLDDLGLLRAIGQHFCGGRMAQRAEAQALGEPWRPWRTVATWYLWRSLDPLPVEY